MTASQSARRQSSDHRSSPASGLTERDRTSRQIRPSPTQNPERSEGPTLDSKGPGVASRPLATLGVLGQTGRDQTARRIIDVNAISFASTSCAGNNCA